MDNTLCPRPLTQLRIAQSGYGVVVVEPLLGFCCRLDVPFIKRPLECAGHFKCELGLAGAWLAFDQDGSFQGHRGIDGHHQVVGRDIGAGALEFLVGHAGSGCWFELRICCLKYRR